MHCGNECIRHIDSKISLSITTRLVVYAIIEDTITIYIGKENMVSAQATILVEQPEEIEGAEQSVGDLGEYPIDSVLIRTENRTVFDIVRRMEKKQYILDPDFQRDFVWDVEKQSRLIESTIIRIPLPVFYLAEQEDGRIVVVDGLQRLTTFHRFLENKFALRSLKGSSDSFNGSFFKDLAPKFQTRIEDTNLTLYLIDSKVPEQARLDIFDRVNSGVALSRQQMRNCLYVGDATRWLYTQAQSEWFLKATGGSLNAKTMRDRESINRFCGFSLMGTEGYAKVSGDMDEFLARTLRRMNLIASGHLDDLAAKFQISMQNNYQVFGIHAFRKHTMPNQSRNVINIALFDVFSVLMADRDPVWVMEHQEQIRAIFYQLMANEEFFRAISLGTNSLNNVRFRFTVARQAFEELDHAD